MRIQCCCAREELRQKCVLSHSRLSTEGGLDGCETTTQGAIQERVRWRWTCGPGLTPRALQPAGLGSYRH